MMPFEIDDFTGLLGEESWINIHSEVENMAFEVFTPVRETYLKKRIAFYKAQEWNLYKECISKEL
jgi:hypothetical protein